MKLPAVRLRPNLYGLWWPEPIGVRTGDSARGRHPPPHFRCGYPKSGYGGVSTLLHLQQHAKSVYCLVDEYCAA